jgi:hypothetical protein
MHPKKANRIISAYFNKYWREGELPEPTQDLLCASEFLYLKYLNEEKGWEDYTFDEDSHKAVCADYRETADLTGYIEYISDRWRSTHRLYALRQYCINKLNTKL